MLKKMLNYVRNILWPSKPEPVKAEYPEVEALKELEQYEGMDLLAESEIDFIELPPYNGKPTVSIDFDGVIHSYKSGWQGADDIPDDPVFKIIQRTKKKYTSIDWLTELINSDTMNIAIFSSRNNQEGGIRAMQSFLLYHGMEYDTLMKISFPEHKPPSHVLIDDRCLRFTGEFFSVDQILKFTPWKMR